MLSICSLIFAFSSAEAIATELDDSRLLPATRVRPVEDEAALETADRLERDSSPSSREADGLESLWRFSLE